MDESNDIADLLQSSDRQEALDWLQRGGSKCNIGEMSHTDAIALVQRLYELGAMEVVVVDIAENAGFASTDTLIATLPDNRYMRDRILQWNNERLRYMGFDATEDSGQKYLMVWFD